MNPGRYFMPNMVMNPMMMRNGYGMARGAGLFGRIMRGIRSFNWSGLLNGANKTLNVMNQTIPLIKEAKPMVGNVKNMIKLARAFNSQTNNVKNKNDTKIVKTNNYAINKTNNHDIKKQNNVTDNNYPIFFV